ncbi:MAG: response regulator [Bdellovibrionota bacterium]
MTPFSISSELQRPEDRGEGLKHKSILVVEDDHDTRVALREVLENEDYIVVTATNGRMALEILKNFRPSLILLDIMMPIMDGFDFLAWVGKNASLRSIPVVTVSAHVLAAKLPEGVVFIKKPLEIDTVLKTVSGLLSYRTA